MMIRTKLQGMRILRNPLQAAIWALELGIDRFDSPRHRRRIGEYCNYTHDLIDALRIASGASDGQVRSIVDELEVEGDALDSDVPHWAASAELVRVSYGLVRLLSPDVVIETGIGAGASSRSILIGLRRNGRGHLHSIELPTPKAEMLPKIGYLVPDDLHGRWTREIGASQRLLPRKLREVGEVNLFLHDSRHSYRNQRMEYRAVWPALRAGGVIISDDVSNDALLEEAENWGVTPIIVPQDNKESPIGLLVKPSSEN